MAVWVSVRDGTELGLGIALWARIRDGGCS